MALRVFISYDLCKFYFYCLFLPLSKRFSQLAVWFCDKVVIYFAAGITRGMNKVTIGSGPAGPSAGYG